MGPSRGGDYSGKEEKFLLDFQEDFSGAGLRRRRPGIPQEGVQFVQGAQAFYPGMVLGDPFSAQEARFAPVPG
jgi:hypothetical protein